MIKLNTHDERTLTLTQMERLPLSPNMWTELLKCYRGLFYAGSSPGFKSWVAEVSMDWNRIGYPAAYLRFFRIRIGFGYSLLKTFGSGQVQDISLILQLNFPESDSRCDKWWWQCFRCYIMDFILSVQYVLHSSQSIVIRITLSLIFPTKWK